jgi:hypothetical protein
MKQLIIILSFATLLFGCKKDLTTTVMRQGLAPVVTLSATPLTLSEATAKDTVETIQWNAADYGFSAAVGYTVEIAKAGTNFAAPKQVSNGSATMLKYVGSNLNEAAISLGIAPGTTGQLDIRVRYSVSDSVFSYTDKKVLQLTTYVVSLPALLVQGGNGWTTPSTRTTGYLLTSVNYDGKYEGYLNLPNADGWGGDAFKLISTTDGKSYGWGTSSTTMSVGGGNLWLTPSPAYMKVNADINALTINYTPVKFYISGDNNGWSTSATPMTYDGTTKTWVANNVSFTAGNAFVFTSNGSYDISYKVNTDGKLVYAGPPGWAGKNITVSTTGTYKVTLDLSGGDGNYTYKIQ